MYANLIVSFSSLPLAASKGYYMDEIHYSELRDKYVTLLVPGASHWQRTNISPDFTLWMVQQ